MKLNDTIQAAINGAKAGLKKLLGQERVSQFANKDPNNKLGMLQRYLKRLRER